MPSTEEMGRDEAKQAMGDAAVQGQAAYDAAARLKNEITLMVEIIQTITTKGLKGRQAEVFRGAFGIPREHQHAVENLFFGDLDSRIQSGRDLYKWASKVQDIALEAGGVKK